MTVKLTGLPRHIDTQLSILCSAVPRNDDELAGRNAAALLMYCADQYYVRLAKTNGDDGELTGLPRHINTHLSILCSAVARNDDELAGRDAAALLMYCADQYLWRLAKTNGDDWEVDGIAAPHYYLCFNFMFCCDSQ